MLAPGLFVWAKFVNVPKDAAVVEAVGQQWHWSYRFPGKDGKLGTVDARYVSDENPFGMNPDDPNGQDDVLVSSPELHLPIGKPVKAAAALQGRAAQLLDRRSSASRWTWCRAWSPTLVHAHAHRRLRPAVRGTLRHRAFRDARPHGGG